MKFNSEQLLFEAFSVIPLSLLFLEKCFQSVLQFFFCFEMLFSPIAFQRKESTRIWRSKIWEFSKYFRDSHLVFFIRVRVKLVVWDDGLSWCKMTSRHINPRQISLMTICNLTRVSKYSSNMRPYQFQKTVAMIFLEDRYSLNFNSVGSSSVFHIMEAFFILGNCSGPSSCHLWQFVEENLHHLQQHNGWRIQDLSPRATSDS